MKTNILKITAILLILAGSIFSCTTKKPDEPVEFTCTEYSLSGTLCQWAEFDATGGNELIVINSADEFKKYRACAGAGYDSDSKKEISFFSSSFNSFLSNRLIIDTPHSNNGVKFINLFIIR